MTNGKSNSMKVVSLKTGLSAHVIRAWEKRYNAITPERTDTNHRLYSDEDIERLCLLRNATEAGHSIGRIAGLTTEELRELVSDIKIPFGNVERPRATESVAPALLVDECFQAINRMDGKVLENHLQRAALSLSQPLVIDQVVVPLIQRIGDAWQEGTLRVAHEHLASYVIRAFLTSMISSYQVSELAPKMIVTTPAGHIHELGAMLAATTAASQGWQVTYLGPNLPAEEIASTVIENDAKAVCLSIVFPAGDQFTVNQLNVLKKYLDEDVVIIVGGRAAVSYRETLENIRAKLIVDIPELRREFESLSKK